MLAPKHIHRSIKIKLKLSDSNDQEQLADARCLVVISVGQQYHEDDLLIATLDTISSQFKSFSVLLGDSLQRYNMAILNQDYNAQAYHDLAIEEGNLWLKRNSIFQQYPNFESVIRWDNFLNDPDFSFYLDKIETLMREDSNYYAHFAQTCHNYLGRFAQRFNPEKPFDPEAVYQLSLKYVVEECAALCLWGKYDYAFDVYPRRHNSAMEATRMIFYSKKTKKIKPISLQFKNHHLLTAQKFVTLGTERLCTA